MAGRRRRRRRVGKEKSQSQRKHTMQRALVRFGLEVSNSLYSSMIEAIQSGAAEFLERQSNRVTVWAVDAEGECVAVAYDKLRGTIATMMPVEWFKKESQLEE